ncbi:MAG: methyltransferase domain-containing protein [Gemmatimonadota bacterium]|nr:methyltransferase domain-containing protein [Gemmatimonadota bacterium]
MTSRLFAFAQSKSHRGWIEAALACRALLFLGRRFKCPCCGWSLRAFTHGGTSLRVRENGYCPRCNAKARHRRDWLFLREHTNLFTDPIRLLHVSPKYALARRLVRVQSIDFVSVDIAHRPYVTHRADVTDLPFDTCSFDAVICIHVLEHIPDDRKALKELHRVLKPGGWAVITVPIDFSRPTHEDPAIVSPEERRRLFGEEQHVRAYGCDFAHRLSQAGFQVSVHAGADLGQETKDRYGLLDDENVFYCIRNGISDRHS